jgi:hypothetical protein
MPIMFSVAKSVPPTITTRIIHETLGLDDIDLVIERGGALCRSVVAEADTIRNSLVHFPKDHA